MTFIDIPNWDDFQHADTTKRGRAPAWIKTYTRLLSDDDYLDLTPVQRAVLHGIWLEYARSGRKVPENTSKLSRRLGLRVTKRTLEAIENHGFIVIRQDNVTPLTSLEEKRGEVLAKASTPRRDELWESLELAMGRKPGTEIERKRWNAALKELRQAGATPEDVLARAALYRKEWPSVELTPHGLAANWSRFGDVKLVELRPHACECGMRFASEAKLTEHRENVHGEWANVV